MDITREELFELLWSELVSTVAEHLGITPAILGHANDIGNWVGRLTKPYLANSAYLHRVEVHYDLSRGLFIAEVQLFADSQTPSYGVVLGRFASSAT